MIKGGTPLCRELCICSNCQKNCKFSSCDDCTRARDYQIIDKCLQISNEPIKTETIKTEPIKTAHREKSKKSGIYNYLFKPTPYELS